MLRRALVVCKFTRDKLYFKRSFLFWRSLRRANFWGSAALPTPPRDPVNESLGFFSAV